MNLPTPFNNIRPQTRQTIIGYHWAEKLPFIITLDMLTPGTFYFCDDQAVWASSGIPGMMLYRITANISNPKIIHDPINPYEGHHGLKTNEHMAEGYDSLVYTSSPDIDRMCGHVRQGVLYYPHKQITSIALMQASVMRVTRTPIK